MWRVGLGTHTAVLSHTCVQGVVGVNAQGATNDSRSFGSSLSPRMHQWIYDSLGLDYRYKAIDISLNRVDSIVNKLRNQGSKSQCLSIQKSRRPGGAPDGTPEIII